MLRRRHVYSEGEPIGPGGLYGDATLSADAEPDRLPPAHILLVEDNADTREMYAMFLAMSGFRVDLAKNASDAMGHMATMRPDLAVVDIAPPAANGIEWCRSIRRHADDRTPGLIAITCLDLEPAETDGLREAGVDALLFKPCLPDDFAADVRVVLTHSARLRKQSRELLHRAQLTTTESGRMLEHALRLQDWARRKRRPRTDD